MYKEIFEKSGLTEAEAGVYDALIELGQASPSQIATLSGQTRENTYFVLSRLEKFGLVSKISIGNKMGFVAESPSKLLEFCAMKIKKIQKVKIDLQESVETVKNSISLKVNHPIVRYTEGLKGIEAFLLETLETHDNGYHYGVIDRSWDSDFLNWADDSFVKKRIKKNIFLNIIAVENEFAHKLAAKDSRELRKTIIVPPSKLAFPKGTYLNICGDKVVFIVKQFKDSENIGIIIDHKIIAQTIRGVFKMVWGFLEDKQQTKPKR